MELVGCDCSEPILLIDSAEGREDVKACVNLRGTGPFYTAIIQFIESGIEADVSFNTRCGMCRHVTNTVTLNVLLVKSNGFPELL